MSSCRGRAEVFARHLTTKLKTLGVQVDNTSKLNNGSLTDDIDNNTRLAEHNREREKTILNNPTHPRTCAVPFFDYDNDAPESPASSAEECEYLPLVESTPPQTQNHEANCTLSHKMAFKDSPETVLLPISQLTDNRYNGFMQLDVTQCEEDQPLQKPVIISIEQTFDGDVENKVLDEQDLLKPTTLCIEYEEPIEKEEEHVYILGTCHQKVEEYPFQYTIQRVTSEDSLKSEKMKEGALLVEQRATSTTPTPIIVKGSLESAYSGDYEEDERPPQRVRRCSSLKTSQTPPGTPSRKKIVRFADALGLDLADIKTFLDDIPTIPRSAYEDLKTTDTEPSICHLQFLPKSDKMLMPLFQQPGGFPCFLDLVKEKMVVLENAVVTDHLNNTITGCVRVRNLDFHKSVHIRYSLDGWCSYADLKANYVENSCDGFSDKFTFVLFGNSLQMGQRLEFAVRYQCKGDQYWDNNYGANYCFQCLSRYFRSGSPTIQHSNTFLNLLNPTIGEGWCSSFY